MSKHRILAIGAHPDDIELGLGGTLAKYVEEGKEVYALILSRGEKGVSDDITKDKGLKGKIREEETRKALNFLGVKDENIKVLGLPDGGIKPDERIIDEIYEYIMEIRPDIIFTHFFEDYPQENF